jgi:excisionase family DNA binding protein
VPDLFTVEEAAGVLRVGRTAAYQLARRYLATGGSEGLPVVRVGRLLRVPRAELEKLTGGPITWPLPGPTPATTTAAPTSSSRRARSQSRSRRRTDAAQLALLDGD